MKVMSVFPHPRPSSGGRGAIKESLAATFTLTFMAPATPNDETAPLFVYERAMPAMGGRGILNRRRQRKGPIAGMARSYTGEKGRVSR